MNSVASSSKLPYGLSDTYIPPNEQLLIDLAKDVLKPMPCKWKKCNTELNCWASHEAHTKSHLTVKGKGAIYQCSFDKCSQSFGKAKDSLITLIHHVERTHIARNPLPCPVLGCTETFPRKTVSKHFKHCHEDFIPESFAHKSDLYASLNKSVRPCHYELPPVPSFPKEFDIDTWTTFLLTPRVQPRRNIYTNNMRPRKSLPQRANVWRVPAINQSSGKQSQKEEEADEDVFNDIPDDSSEVDELEQLAEIVVQPTAETDLLVSRPLPYTRGGTGAELILVRTGAKGLEEKLNSS